jgi:hypothetical protein
VIPLLARAKGFRSIDTDFVNRLMSFWTATLFFLWSPIRLVALVEVRTRVCIVQHCNILFTNVDHQDLTPGIDELASKGCTYRPRADDENISQLRLAELRIRIV